MQIKMKIKKVLTQKKVRLSKTLCDNTLQNFNKKFNALLAATVYLYVN